MKKGFSLSEMLVTLIIIGVICTISIPLVSQSIDDHGPLFRTAYRSVADVSLNLVNDTTIFPTAILDNTSDTFCEEFFATMNVIGTADCTTSTIPDTPNVVTTNGMKWYGFNGEFNQACPVGADTDCMLVRVDINGEEGANINTYTSSFRDIYDIYIKSDGHVIIEDDASDQNAGLSGDSLEAQYLKNQ